jgi:glycogen synthase
MEQRLRAKQKSFLTSRGWKMENVFNEITDDVVDDERKKLLMKFFIAMEMSARQKERKKKLFNFALEEEL